MRTALLASALTLPLLAQAQFQYFANPSCSCWTYFGTNTYTDTYAANVEEQWGTATATAAFLASPYLLQGTFYANVYSYGANALGDPNPDNGFASAYFQVMFTVNDYTPYTLSFYEAYSDNGQAGESYGGYGPGGLLRPGCSPSQLDNCPGTYCCALTYFPFLNPGTAAGYGTNGVLIPHTSGYTFIVQAGDIVIDGGHQLAAYYNHNILFSMSLIPELTIQNKSGAGGSQLALSWASVFTNFTLHASSDLGPTAQWVPVTNAPSIQNGIASVTIDPTTSTTRFFQMRKQ